MIHFITEEEDRIILVRKKDMKSAPRRLVEGRDPESYTHTPVSLEGKTHKKMEPLYVEFSQVARGKISTITHHGDEFIHVLEGELEVIYNDTSVVLKEGDNLYLDGRIPHAYRSQTKKRTKAIMIIAE